MSVRQGISADMTVSAVVHLLALALLIFFSGVNPFAAAPTEPIAVDIVTPQDVEKIQENVKDADDKSLVLPTPAADSSKQSTAAASPPAPKASPSAAAPSQQQAQQQQSQQQTQQQPQQQAQQQPQRQQTQQPPPAAPAPRQQAAAAPAYALPEPDITVKYNVLLGLPPDMPVNPSGADNKGTDNFDAAATKAADLRSSVITEFRQHLKTCAKLPAELTASDDIKVKLRVFMTPQGRLAAAPILIEASASAKGPLLMQAAIKAIEACQPYAMLPADQYKEWKVLDLNFTPQDLAS
jgi:cell division protein FtsN